MVNPPYTTIPITTSATSKNRLLIFVLLTNTLNIIIAIPIMKVPTKGFKRVFFQWICGDIFFLINYHYANKCRHCPCTCSHGSTHCSQCSFIIAPNNQNCNLSGSNDAYYCINYLLNNL